MIDLKIYDTAREGNYKEFMKIYEKDNNSIYSTLMDTVLVSALFGEEPYDDRFKIVKFLIEKKVDINLPTRVQKMNALHCFYYGVWRPDKDYLFEVTKLLVEYGVNLNAQDFNKSIPLQYLITRNRLETEDIEKTLRYLVENGSDYTIKNKYGNSCLDSAKKFEWRNGFLDIVKEYEESKKS
ncbi:ankyrin repeat domain-containing protein [Fusobacterium sp. PH5-44]|uniref:ankyrin repeat domain-containing protein n=1 Tax=unclassified Fusobacterium TaxID=2648384 RepID=UPI003D20F7A2